MPAEPTFQLFVGPVGLEQDAIMPVRFKLGDENGVEFSDDVFRKAVISVVKDFSRHMPAEAIVGDPLSNTSPLVTVKNQQFYAPLNASNGFTSPPITITDVLYRASGYLANISEYSYMSMMSMSPMSRFFATPYAIDSPSVRILIESYAQEAQKWGLGYWKKVVTPNGLGIQVLPIPDTPGIPIYVRYGAEHAPTTVAGVDHYYSIPEVGWEPFCKLLQAEAMEREAMRNLRRGQLIKSGLNTRNINATAIMDEVTILRRDAYAALGSLQTVGQVSE